MAIRKSFYVALLTILAMTTALADTLVLRDGQMIDGTYLGGNSRTVRFRVDGVLKSYPLSNVEEIHFGSEAVTRADSANQRFRELDRNGDGIISRFEWPGSFRDFDMLDRNYDNRLSRDEVASWTVADWKEERFRVLDFNHDGVLSRSEWQGSASDFQLLDRNRDGFMSRQEAASWTASDWREQRFREWDHNDDDVINRAEWHGIDRDFDRLDRNRDGVLSRDELGSFMEESAPLTGRRRAAVHDEYVVPAGTVLRVRTNETIDSDNARVGDTFSGTLEEDLAVREEVIAERGAPVKLRISEVDEAGEFRGRTTLVIDLVEIRVGGSDYALSTTQVEQRGRSQSRGTAIAVGGGAALGAIIGAIAGGGKGAAIGAAIGAGAGGGYQILTKGEKLKIPAETVLEFTMQRDLYMRR